MHWCNLTQEENKRKKVAISKDADSEVEKYSWY